MAVVALVSFSVAMPSSAETPGGARGMCGPPPPPKPQRVAGGESAKPPGNASKLPCAPTRRTEKKMPPAPPTLVAKLSYGDNQDWSTDRNDVFNLLRIVGEQYQTPFRAIVVEFDNYTFNPQETPVMYMSGHNPFKFDSAKRRLVRDFIEGGGTLMIDSCCGSKPFAESAKSEIRNMFPDRNFKRLALDHPVFYSHNVIKTVEYAPTVKDAPGNEPYLEGIDFGCRTAVFFSPYDLSCGWDYHSHPQGERVGIEDAVKLGVNMLTYALVNRKQGEVLSRTRAFTDATEESRGKIVLAQVKYEGDWNRHVAATSNLLADLDKNFPADVKYGRTDMALSDPGVFSYPVLYMTGHDDFKLSEAEVAGLRKYLEGGRTLLSESCCGRQSFDDAFRREMARVLPGRSLAVLPAAHPVFSVGYDLQKTPLPDHLKQNHPGHDYPLLEGIDINGAAAVIHSRYGLSCGWEEEDCKYCKGYDSQTAIRLGVNALGYALTH
jgi:hypothetical protein